MERRLSIAILSGLVTVLSVMPQRSPTEVQDRTKKMDGVTVEYKVVLPDGYDPHKAYPGILAFGGGPQTMRSVDGVLERNFRAEAERRGYIVVAPAAPDGALFFEEGARIIPALLKTVLADYRIQNDKFHIAGVSNGGIAAFHIAALYPQYFVSITAFPGYMWQSSTAKLQAISGKCVFMYVGENDPYMWHAEMKQEADYLQSHGTVAHYSVIKGEAHRIDSVANENAYRLFENFEKTKKGCSR